MRLSDCAFAAMPNQLHEANLLTEASRELCEWAQALNPDAEPTELLELAMTALGALTGYRTPERWVDAAVTRAGEQLRWQ